MGKRMNRQHEVLRVPNGWTEQDKALVMQLERIHDDLYNRLTKAVTGQVFSVLGITPDDDGDVTLTEESLTDIGLASQTDVDALKSDMGIVEDGDTATHNISSGQYVIWHGSLYTASSAIATGDALSASNLTAVSNGGFNSLNEKLNYNTVTFTASVGSGYTVINFGKVCVFYMIANVGAKNTWTDTKLGSFSVAAKKSATSLVRSNDGKVYTLQIDAGSKDLKLRTLGVALASGDVRGQIVFISE